MSKRPSDDVEDVTVSKVMKTTDLTTRCIDNIRVLCADMVEKANSGCSFDYISDSDYIYDIMNDHRIDGLIRTIRIIIMTMLMNFMLIAAGVIMMNLNVIDIDNSSNDDNCDEF